jgi:sugar-specific transcriptional regulator TrmB
MNDKNRDIVMRLRLNREESKALRALMTRNNTTASDLLRGFIHEAAATLR